mgnify:FL=1|jgi:hypothetical protein
MAKKKTSRISFTGTNVHGLFEGGYIDLLLAL